MLLVFPVLRTEDVVGRIIDAICRRQLVVYVPGLLRYVFAAVGVSAVGYSRLVLLVAAGLCDSVCLRFTLPLAHARANRCSPRGSGTTSLASAVDGAAWTHGEGAKKMQIARNNRDFCTLARPLFLDCGRPLFILLPCECMKFMTGSYVQARTVRLNASLQKRRGGLSSRLATFA